MLLADQAQLSEEALEHFTRGVLARLDGSEPHAANAHAPTTLRVWLVGDGDFAPAV